MGSSSASDAVTILRAPLLHTPRNPFVDSEALVSLSDGAVAFAGERILALDDAASLIARYPEAEVLDRRDMLLLPGMVDCHVHYPQLPVIGAMGLRLLEWLETRTMPEECQYGQADYARRMARLFLQQLVKHGTTSALVFGTHFALGQEIFFEEALHSGLRISSGLVMSDCNLHPALEFSPRFCHEASSGLIHRWHKQGKLRYAVTPRFSLSCSEAMLETAGALLREHPDVLFQSHINENPQEIATVAELFPWAEDYLETYERFGLVNNRSVFAHNVHVRGSELTRLADAGAAVAHCPCSNAFIGSGLFDLRRHIQHEVLVALGSDVGGGTGFCLFKEGLMAYQHQMLHPQGYLLGPAHLLYLATAAGAQALGYAEDIGDLSVGKSADFVLLRPLPGSTLEAVLAHSPSAEASLAAVFTLAGEADIAEVYASGKRHYHAAWQGPTLAG